MTIDHKPFNYPKGENLNFDDHQRGYKQVSVNLPLKFWTFAKQNIVVFRNALIFGIKFIVADKDGGLTYEYPECNLKEKLRLINAKLQETAEKCNQLEDQLHGLQDPEKQKEIDKELNEAMDDYLSQEENGSRETKE